MAAVTRLPTPTDDHWRWQRRAACQGMDVDAFFHPTGERGHERRRREDRAKRICAGARCWTRAVGGPTAWRSRSGSGAASPRTSDAP